MKTFHPHQPWRIAGYTHLEMIIIILFLAIAFPALVELYSFSAIKTTELRVSEQAIILCKQKMELIIADKMSRSRGFSWITAANRYPAENLSGGFTRTVAVTIQSIDNIQYAEVIITVTHSYIEPVTIKTWLTQN